MHIFIDTEFNEFGGQLISMALVKYNGESLYFELPEPEVWGKWVEKHVKPKLLGGTAVLTLSEAQTAIQKFLSDVEWPSIMSDHPADIVHFCKIIDLNYGNYIGTKRGYQFTILPELKSYPDMPHNALSDALALRQAYIEQQRSPLSQFYSPAA